MAKAHTGRLQEGLESRSTAPDETRPQAGGRFQVREALVAVHNAFHNCDGTDPYNGMPLKGAQLKPMNRSDRLGINFSCKGQLRRMPTVGHLHQEPIAEFEILSCQTHTAKNEMTADEYLNHCQAVVSLSETTTSE